MRNILFIIDEIEFKYFEFNVLVTDFWMIKTYLEKGHNVDITTKKDLFIENNLPYSLIYKTIFLLFPAFTDYNICKK